MLLKNQKLPKVTFMELSVATNGFSSSNLIGRGSYGSTYRGTLGKKNTTLAVKVLNLKQKGAAMSFKAECSALRSIRHRNLIRVITTCSSVDHKGDEFKALVYKFMPNGNLEDFLHRSEDRILSQGNLSLTWRLRFAIDIASGLEYLHHQCRTSIIHGDLKPSNVLLDRHMNACVGDFGLAKFRSESARNSSRHQNSGSIGVIGTLGYVAPEYGMGGKASIRGDVYSFGICLLELFTGKRPTDGMFTDDINIHLFAKEALPERVTEIVDPSLLSEARGCNVERSLTAILKIAVSCSMELAGERMDIRQVVAELCKIKDRIYSIGY